MSDFDEYTSEQLVTAALGDLDFVRDRAEVTPTLSDNLNMVNAMLEELGKRVNGLWEVKMHE